MFKKKVLPISVWVCETIPVEIKEHRLQAFIELYKQEFGITLTKSEAHKKASLLMHYVMLCIKPLAKVDEQDIIMESNESE